MDGITMGQASNLAPGERGNRAARQTDAAAASRPLLLGMIWIPSGVNASKVARCEAAPGRQCFPAFHAFVRLTKSCVRVVEQLTAHAWRRRDCEAFLPWWRDVLERMAAKARGCRSAAGSDAALQVMGCHVEGINIPKVMCSTVLVMDGALGFHSGVQ